MSSMKRAEDFRSFMASRNPLAESVYSLPPLGDLDLEFVTQVDSEFPVADGVFDKSDLRDGLKIWDSVYLPASSFVATDVKRRNDLSTLRSINTDWESTKDTLSHIGRLDGEHYVRPKGEYILDLMSDDIRLLQGAHILTHRAEFLYDDITDDDWSYGQLADVFMRNLVKLFVAKKYALKINVHPEAENPEEDSFGRYGIEIFGSFDLRNPMLFSGVSLEEDRARRSPDRLVRDKTTIGILGAVHVEAHPAGAKKLEDGTTEPVWKEINKWSCLPTLIALAGWEGVDFLTHSERIEMGGEVYNVTQSADLQGMSGFAEVIASMKAVRGEVHDSNEVYSVEGWLESEDFKQGLSVTPQLPCPVCIRPNSKTPGAVLRPMSLKPRKGLNELKETRIPELKAWVDYATFMKACLSIGRTATAYASGSVTKMKARNSAYSKRHKLQAKIAGLKKKRIRKANQGFITESEVIGEEIEKLTKQLK